MFCLRPKLILGSEVLGLEVWTRSVKYNCHDHTLAAVLLLSKLNDEPSCRTYEAVAGHFVGVSFHREVCTVARIKYLWSVS